MNMNSFFNEYGYLNLDELVMNTDSYKKIMDDGVVSDDELLEQSHKVMELFHQIEAQCDNEVIDLIRNAISELGVLFTIYNYKELQSIK